MDTLVDGMLKGVGEYRANMRYNIIDAATGLLLVWLLLPRYGVAGYLSPSPPPSSSISPISAARLTRGHGVPAPAALLAAYGGSGSWGLVAAAPDLWQAVVPDRAPLILLLLVFLYLACYGAALLLCGALRREELSWLFSLLRGEKSPKT